VGLTDGFLTFVVWAGALAFFAWLVVRSRACGPGWVRMLRRAGYHLALVLVTLLATGLSLNDQYGWYANWGDLETIFSGTAAGNVVAAGAEANQAADGPASGDTGSGHTTVPLTDVPGLAELGLTDKTGPAAGQIRDYTVSGPISGVAGTVTVWFPEQYTDPKWAGHRFPVIEAFHGVPGSTRQLWYNMSLGKIVAAQTAAGKLAPSVIVMPSYAPHQLDTECVDGATGQPQMEKWITRDVTNWAEHHLRVLDNRSSWATFGLSAGAWCASMVAMLHPDIYSAAISLGGYYQPTFEAPYIPFKPNSPQWRHYDLLAVAHNHPPKIALWLQTSKADTVSYGTTQRLLADAKPPLSVTADVLPNAGHRVSVWVALIPQTLQWLGITAPGFHAAAAPHLPGQHS